MKVCTALYKKIWLLFMAIGLLCAIGLNYERHGIETKSNSIDMVVDYDSVLAMMRRDEPSVEEGMEKLKEAGITSFALYDTTLEKLVGRGAISLLGRADAGIYRPEFLQAMGNASFYVVVPKSNPSSLAHELEEDLVLRLGRNKVSHMENNSETVLGIDGNMDTIKAMNLGILTSDAETIHHYGFQVVVRPTNYRNIDVADIQHFWKRMDTIENISGIMFVGKEVLGFEPEVSTVAKEMRSRNIPLYMIEAPDQLQYDKQSGLFDMIRDMQYYGARSYAMSKEELWKIAPEEAAQRYFISDIERNVRVNLFPLYKDPQEGMSQFETNLSYISMTTDKLKARGFTFGKASIMPEYYPNKVLAGFGILGISASLWVLLSLLLPVPKQGALFLTVLSVLGAGATMVLPYHALLYQMAGLVGAITFPVIGMITVMDIWRKKEISEPLGYKKIFVDGVKYIVLAFLISLAGGLYIGAIMGNTRFFLELDIYRGVKLTFLAPLVITAWAYIQRFPLLGDALHSPEDFVAFGKRVLQIPIRLGSLLLLAFIGIGGIIFIGRSGHTAGIPVSGAEIALRRFLEETLYARPRGKEFMIGHPMFFVAMAALYRKWPHLLHFFLVMLAAIAQDSLVETFAHIRTPFFMSLVRGIDGLLLGIVVGLLCLIGLVILKEITAWIGKRGHHA